MNIVNEYEIVDGSVILIVTEYDDGTILIVEKE